MNGDQQPQDQPQPQAPQMPALPQQGGAGGYIPLALAGLLGYLRMVSSPRLQGWNNAMYQGLSTGVEDYAQLKAAQQAQAQQAARQAAMGQLPPEQRQWMALGVPPAKLYERSGAAAQNQQIVQTLHEWMQDPSLTPQQRAAANSMIGLASRSTVPLKWEDVAKTVRMGYTPKPPGTLDAAYAVLAQDPNNPQAQAVVKSVEKAETFKAGLHPKEPKDTDTPRMDRSYNTEMSQLTKLSTPLEQQADRMGRLIESVNQRSPQADALIAPELLTAMAGGQASGLRMNEAEISRIVGGRTHWEALKAAANQYNLDPTKGLSITDEQRRQIARLAQAVHGRIQQKLNSINNAIDQLNSAQSVDEQRSIVAKARRDLTGIGDVQFPPELGGPAPGAQPPPEGGTPAAGAAPTHRYNPQTGDIELIQ